MPEVSIVITGAGEWERYTKPFIDSIQKHTDGFHVVCVDLGSNYPDVEGVQMVRHPLTSYPAALNMGMEAHKADWYFLCNNDMLITKPLSAKRFETLDTTCLYSWIMVPASVVGFPYLESWSMFVPYQIRESIGLFDENFKPMWFEGADYCYRAQKAGFRMADPLDREEWGVYHREDERKGERVDYMHKHIKERQANRLYLQRKHGLIR